MTLDLTTLEASLKRDEELAAQLKAGYHGFSREGVASALLDRVKDCREMEEQLRIKQIALDEAFAVIERQRASLAEAVRALAFDVYRDEGGVRVSADAYYNLMGALHDLERQSADPVCVKTIRRVVEQLGEARAALSSLQPRKDTP